MNNPFDTAAENTAKKRKKKPGPGRPTQFQIEERNRELLDTTLSLLLEKGIEGVTIREIVNSVGMSKRTVVSRYGNKASLLKAALKKAIDEWVLPEARLKAAETDDLTETLLAIGRVLMENFMSPTGLRLARIMNSEIYRFPEISTYAYEQCTGPIIGYLSDLIRQHVPDGKEFLDAERYALSFSTLISTPFRATTWGVEFSDESIEAHIQHVVRLFLHGLLHTKV